MEGARMLNSQFPPGFRFHPTDQELISHYLRRKVTASLPHDWIIIADIELYKHNPWDLPDKALFGQGEWFFFSPRDRKYPNGVRPNRATSAGYWKATGTDKPIMSAGGVQCIGVKKALVFYKGKPPKGIKTDWVMQEYRLLDSSPQSKAQNHPGSMRLDDWVLCRVRLKGKYELPEPVAVKEAAAVKEKSSSGEWSEHLSYFAESIPEEDGENSAEDSSSGLMWYSSDHLGRGGYSEVEQKQQQQQQPPPPPHEQGDASAMSSGKRKQTFGVLDDLLMLQTGKKLQCGAEGRMQQADAVYDDEGVFQQYFL